MNGKLLAVTGIAIELLGCVFSGGRSAIEGISADWYCTVGGLLPLACFVSDELCRRTGLGCDS